TIFGQLRAQRPDSRIVCVHDWDGFGRLLEPGAPDVLENVKGSAATARRAALLIKELKPNFLFIHFDDVDHAGHEFGWKSAEYFRAVEDMDGLVGQVLAALDEAGIRDRTVVLVTADHGGVGKKHGGATMEELEIPWIIAGPGVRVGHQIQSPVNTYDTAATLAMVFDIRAPATWIARPVKEAFTGGQR
ncbi:MAG TPA: alkaline phosphatase, partial [Dongiaceae bacterium]|nr:alkaline phosphatase [Dongiaceae bacterium]